MSRIRLRPWDMPTEYYTVNLDGVPLGCDGVFADPALVIIVGQDVAKVPHCIAKDGAMVFEYCRRMDARRAAVKALHDYNEIQWELNKGVHFDRAEARRLRALAEYCMRGYMGPHAGTVEMIRRKVPR